MIKYFKKILARYPFLKRLLLPFFKSGRVILFFLYKTFNIRFSYQMTNGTKLRFFPKGQIARNLFFKEFENTELEIFQSIVKNGSIMIDAGANIGLYSIIGSHLVGRTGKVYSFEPSKTTFNLLMKNIDLNKIKNIFPINKGFGDKIGENLILKHHIGNNDAENYIELSEKSILNQGLNKNYSEVITLDTIDNFIMTNNIGKVDFVKIDVEGYEYYVLKGTEKLLKMNPDLIILFECADHLAKRAGSNQLAVFDFLHELDIEIVFWNEKEKKWINDRKSLLNSGQFLCGKNIMSILNNKRSSLEVI